MKIVGFAGKAGSGKDTLADFLQEIDPSLSRYAFAQPIKDMLLAGLGLAPSEYDDRSKKEAVIPGLGFSYRRAAQTLGTEWGRSLNADLWLELAKQEAESLSNARGKGLIITDVRFPNEAQWIRSAGGTVVHVIRPEAVTPDNPGHASEAGLTVEAADWTIFNDQDLAALEASAEMIYENLIRCSFIYETCNEPSRRKLS